MANETNDVRTALQVCAFICTGDLGPGNDDHLLLGIPQK